MNTLRAFDPDHFYTGTHKFRWIWNPLFKNVPLFVSVRAARDVVNLHPAVTRHAWDSGGFTEAKMFGGWKTGTELDSDASRQFSITADEYLEQLDRLYFGVGEPDFISPMDLMCEPEVIFGQNQHLPRHHPAYFHGTRRLRGIPDDGPDEDLDSAVIKHLMFTVENFAYLRRNARPGIREKIIPVLQGQREWHYKLCHWMYGQAGFDLSKEPRVGLGSVCRRHTPAELLELERLVRHFASKGLKVHGFGMKSLALMALGGLVFSADSMSWSYDARQPKSLPLPGCSHGKNGTGKCANCPLYALDRRAKLLARLARAHAARLAKAA